jgi:very-short-patch-repair endonuclease
VKHYTSPERRTFAQIRRRRPTRGEAIVWSAVRAGRLDRWKFKREVPIGPYTADFSCAAARLVVEVDGRTHDDLERALRDDKRDRWFRQQGWNVDRLPDAVVIGSPALAIETIRRALGAPSPDPR